MEHIEDSEAVGSSVNAGALTENTIVDGKYVILAELGRGASGVVYKARHLALDQFVALKIIDRTLLPSEAAVKRFQNEAALLSSFAHPSIVKFNSFGNLPDGRQYMVLEFLEGVSLQKLLEDAGALPASRAIPLFIDIAEALNYAHEKGIVHRDVKPGNVMVIAEDGKESAKLLDFGIFKTQDPASQSLTKTGLIVGSADYMSPEQCKQGAVDQRSDIYSLGCLMYEVLAGSAPMHADNELMTMSNHLNLSIERLPSKYLISPAVEQIVLKCLKKNPAERFQSARELIEALRKSFDNAPLRTESKKSALLLPVSCFFFLIMIAGIVLAMTRQSSTLAPDKKASDQVRQHVNLQSPGNGTLAVISNMDAFLAQQVELSTPEEEPLVDTLARDATLRIQMHMDPPPSAAKIEACVKRERRNRAVNSPIESTAQRLLRIRHLKHLALVEAVCNKQSETDDALKQALALALVDNDAECRLEFHNDANDVVNFEVQRCNFEHALAVNKLDETVASGTGLLVCYEARQILFTKLGKPDEVHRVCLLSADALAASLRNDQPFDPTRASEVVVNLLKEHENKRALSFLKNPVFVQRLKGHSPQPWNYQHLLALTYYRNNNFSQAESNWLQVVDECIADSTNADQLGEILLDYLLSIKKQNKPTHDAAWTILKKIKQKNLNAGRDYLKVLCKIQLNTSILELKSDEVQALALQEISEYENRLPAICAWNRYAVACSLLRVNKEKEAMNAFLQTETDIKGATGEVENDLLQQILQDEMVIESHAGNWSNLEKIYKRALSYQGATPQMQFQTNMTYAKLICNQNLDEAIHVDEANMRNFETHPIADLRFYADCALDLSSFYEKSNKMDLAVEILRKAIAQMELYQIDHSEGLKKIYKGMAVICQKTGRTAESHTYEKKSAAIKVPEASSF